MPGVSRIFCMNTQRSALNGNVQSSNINRNLAIRNRENTTLKKPTSEFAARSGFQILFERAGFRFRSECDSGFDFSEACASRNVSNPLGCALASAGVNRV